MPTGYSVLDNRPLDHWKVTELKEELRRRKLTTKGLKEDLIKRLDEAVRNERELLKEQEIARNIQSHSSETIDMGKNADQTVEHHVITFDINAAVEEPSIGIEFPPKKSEDIDEKFASETKAPDSVVESELDNTESKTNSEDHTEENKVSEVSPDTDLQVKTDSISTDSLSFSEKVELKGDLNANNFHLEAEPVKPEQVQPSSVDDLQESDVKMIQVGEEEEDDLSKKTDNSSGGSPEKLNLDRSSGDESMEEDVLDAKHVDLNDNSIEAGDLKEIRELHVVKEEVPANAEADGFSPDKKDVISEGEFLLAASTEKRKAEDECNVGSVEPVKRQRRWASDPIKIPETQGQQPSDQSSAATMPNEAATPLLTPRRAAASGLDADSPKERIVPVSQKLPTNSLRIDRFLRPFTLKAVQELLAKNGTVSSFWMDHIKTHCYVTYSSVEEAVATRNAVYNLQWPPNGGRLLVADFVESEEVKAHIEAPPQPPVPTTPTGPAGAAAERAPSSVPSWQQQQPSPQAPSPSVSAPPAAKEKLLPPPPPPAKAAEPPILTLDDLFKKTKAAPRIYYLPLTEEQVVAKVSPAQGKSTAA